MINLQKIPIKIESDEGIYLVKQRSEELYYEAIFEVMCFHKNIYILDMKALPFVHQQFDVVIGFAFSQTHRVLPPNLTTLEARIKQSKINQKFLTKLVQTHFPGYETYRF